MQARKPLFLKTATSKSFQCIFQFLAYIRKIGLLLSKILSPLVIGGKQRNVVSDGQTVSPENKKTTAPSASSAVSQIRFFHGRLRYALLR